MNDLRTWRNLLAWRLSNLMLGLFATRQYQRLLTNIYIYGLNSAARDAYEGREPPTQYWPGPPARMRAAMRLIDPEEENA